ncbi:MAG: FKBP-type peptidyl-prolyl cis-trans isomerase [Crocinitomicaceae bacterium]|nr:FKBP-type peptidyl-prolyl cis-trans isomerase [Crocinitomicaceae bacterium]
MRRILFILSIGVLLSACGEEEPEGPIDFVWTQENSTNLNQVIAAQEEIDIKLFLEMHKDWDITRTGSGLQYYIYEDGEGDTTEHPQAYDIAEIEYVISLLDGTECYKTEDDEYEEFVVDNSEIESGVQEGIKKMTIGDRVQLIIPSHLGHGISGDLDKIPPMTVLVIDIHLLGIIR